MAFFGATRRSGGDLPIARGEILFGLGKLAKGRRRSEWEAKAQKLFAIAV